MKKELVLAMNVFIVLSLIGLVSAQAQVDGIPIQYAQREEVRAEIKEAVEETLQERRQAIVSELEEREGEMERLRKQRGNVTYEIHLNQTRERIQLLINEGIITDEKGEEIIERIIQARNISVKTRLRIFNASQDENHERLRLELSNGEAADITILPDEAAEIARQRLQTRRENLRMELREEIHKNVPGVVYHIETEKRGKFLGIINTRLRVQGELDPLTGEFQENKPWWSFLVAGEDDLEEDIIT